MSIKTCSCEAYKLIIKEKDAEIERLKARFEWLCKRIGRSSDAHIDLRLSSITEREMSTQEKPHVLMRPKVYIDGDQWCALYGENIQSGVCGFGESPERACADFDAHWNGQNNVPKEVEPDECTLRVAQYRGYIGEDLRDGATDAEREAWLQGIKSRERIRS